ncbi:hypothetical protein EVJ50_08520 [Synechococcus sp. RSCCF101]|uniref:hypothetical protein n=1 Tax=Synechococcus sp. RSCCF101 TaxID=2511069 RepID=UPI001247C41B|nr:hypothetical protein [Synechococcus sp. RSCCF101]QEY32259.1 hypothetical protein EVJ50_08520 [Synechococcus sp. RSCCF101]
MALLRLASIPLRAPMTLVLMGVSIYFGLHWTLLTPRAMALRGIEPQLFWSVELIQTTIVVVVCSLPQLLLRHLSLLMASSRVLTLVVTLLLVITAGLYLLNLRVLSEVLILASAVLLCRLDLTRIRVVPSPLLMACSMLLLVGAGISIGHRLAADWPLA